MVIFNLNKNFAFYFISKDNIIDDWSPILIYFYFLIMKKMIKNISYNYLFFCKKTQIKTNI